MGARVLGSSFRDPSGVVFYKDGIIYRKINFIYKENYDYLLHSGLYNKLTSQNLLIPHNEVGDQKTQSYKIITPLQLPFISYPYEWCFSQLKAAALITLKIQKIALQFEMSLKDASAYNVQFLGCKPIFIDTLSFEKYIEGKPWQAYRQFCMHFLAPLLLMARKSLELNKLLYVYTDGIPLDLTSSLLSIKSWSNLSTIIHIHLHSKAEKFFIGKIPSGNKSIGKTKLIALIENLEDTISSIKLKEKGSLWSNYYRSNNYTPQAFRKKVETVRHFIRSTHPKIIWDLGSNTGTFSHLLTNKYTRVISFDKDALAVEKHYLSCNRTSSNLCTPLVLDLVNPSPSIGWENKERFSIMERGPADTVLALALIHHLSIGNNVPFEKIAIFFAKIARYLIIEFIPKKDSQVQKLLLNRQDIFKDYDQNKFELNLKNFFIIKQVKKIPGSQRALYLMKNRFKL